VPKGSRGRRAHHAHPTCCRPHAQVKCRYYLRVLVHGKGMTPDTKKDATLWVRNYEAPSEAAAPIKVRARGGGPVL